MTRRAVLVVLDGVGIGPTPDQSRYGDGGSNTLGNTLAWAASHRPGVWPALRSLGLGNCGALPGIPPCDRPQAAFGTALPMSPGKDSTTGHWELCGVVLEEPFPTFPNGFPEPLVRLFAEQTGRGILGNKAASGTAILDELGGHHLATGSWILYTSADSVWQLAAHDAVVSQTELYRACQVARGLCTGPWGVSRVIARPFTGVPGHWKRTSGRKDYSLPPPAETLLDRVAAAGLPRIGVGKVDDLFAGRSIQSVHPASNAEAYRLIEEALGKSAGGLILANVIEFDQAWGHRNDVAGFLGGLDELDRVLPRLVAAAQPDDLIIFTADHGNDPTTPSTDHSRERVPVLAVGPKVRARPLGVRTTFADIGQTIAEFLGVPRLTAGQSFMGEIWGG